MCNLYSMTATGTRSCVCFGSRTTAPSLLTRYPDLPRLSSAHSRREREPIPCDVTDKMLAYLIDRADELAAFANKPTAEAELERVVNLIETYESRRWPNGNAAGGKG